MVFTSRIEVFGVKPDFHVSCIINSFHNDLFSEGTLVFSEETFLYFRKRHSRTTVCRLPGRGLFFSEKHVPGILARVLAAKAVDREFFV